jgi:hypothetical protein
VLSVKKNRLISRNLSLDGLSEGPMNRGNPPIPGESCMELSQNLPDRYSVAQLTQHGTKVQKNGSEMDSWYEWVERHSERPTPLYEAEESKTVSFGLQVSPARTSVMCHVRPFGLLSFFTTLYSQKLWRLCSQNRCLG